MIIDIHAHPPNMFGPVGSMEQYMATCRSMAEAARRAGIEKQVMLELSTDNEPLRRLLDERSDAFIGFVGARFTDPAAPEVMERYVLQHGFRGVKVYQEQHFPLSGLLAGHAIYRKAAELSVPVLTHSWHREEGWGEEALRDVGVYFPVALIAELGRRYPETTFIFAHVGGLWDKAFNAARPYPNCLFDVSGFDPERGIVEKAVAVLGAERVLFGSDAPGRNYAAQLAKVKYADIRECDRELIMGGNAARVLRLEQQP